VAAAEHEFLVVYDFAVSAFVHFAAAVRTDFEAGFQGNADEFAKALEELPAEFFAVGGEFEDFLFLGAHRFQGAFDEFFLFELFEEGVN